MPVSHKSVSFEKALCVLTQIKTKRDNDNLLTRISQSFNEKQFHFTVMKRNEYPKRALTATVETILTRSRSRSNSEEY